MKLLGANNDLNGGQGPPMNQSQDDAAVGYVFQRHPHEADFHFAHKQAPQPPRWASGDEPIIDVSTSSYCAQILITLFPLSPNINKVLLLLLIKFLSCISNKLQFLLSKTKGKNKIEFITSENLKRLETEHEYNKVSRVQQHNM